MRARVALAILLSLALALPAYAQQETVEVIVVLEPTTSPVAEVASDVAQSVNGELNFTFQHALQGMTMSVPEGALAGLARNPKVAYVEPVQEVSVAGQVIPEGIDRIDADVNMPGGSYAGVDIAIIDTGIYIGTNPDGSARSHLDLNLRYVTDCTGAILYLLLGGCSGSGNFQDGHGHGTHVAGIAAAIDNTIGTVGVAPGATLWSVKVLDASGSGTTGNVLAGIDFVAANADRIEVANMSLAFPGQSQAIDDAIAGATNAGVTFVVAAGNDSADASGYGPASNDDAITVSALADFDGLPGGLGSPTCRSDQDDTLADFSNFGADVQIAAPGVCIYSTYLDDGYTTFSGTSMAAPFVTGAVARYILDHGIDPGSRADVEGVKASILAGATPQTSACGFTGDVDAYPEPLLFLNSPVFGGDGTCGGTTGSPGNQPPSVSFTWSCVDLDCSFDATVSDPDGDPTSVVWDFGDGGSSTLEDPVHSYVSGGDYGVTLTADDGTDQTVVSEMVTATAPTSNQPPSVSFTWSCVDLDCSFDATVSDPDGDPTSVVWDFGDGGSSTLEDPVHSYVSGGDYGVTLTADDGTDQTVVSEMVTATEPSPTTPLATAVVAPIIVDGRDATISISIVDASLGGIEGASVQGEWTYQDSRGRVRTANSAGTTDANGEVVFQRKLPRDGSVQSFCLTDVTVPGYEYVVPPLECGYPLE